ncbi:type IV pilus biogenesis protein PilM [Chloroflexota bacterium]
MATTLFIDDTNIRLLVTKGKRVHKWARLPLETGLVSDGVIVDEAQVTEQLKELFRLSKVSPSKVIAGISGLNSIYRLITMPELPEAVQAEAVRHEAGRVIPVSLDQVYLSYQALPAAKGEALIFLAAFPKNAADSLIRTLRQADVEPYLMDLAPLALCRTADEPRAIIINAWSTNLDIVVMVDRIPQVLRSLSLPSESTSPSDILPAIAEELDRTITFYNSGHLEKPLGSTVPILVSGDLAEAPESWETLAGTSGYSVSALPTPMEFPEGFNPSQFMVNVGLALKELSPEKGATNVSLVNFNALPDVYQPKPLPVAKFLIPIAIGAIGIGAVVYTVFLLQGTITKTNDLRVQLPPVQNLVAEHQLEIADLKGQIAEIPQIEPLEITAGVLDGTYLGLELVRAQVNGDMSEIWSLMPEEIVINDDIQVNHEVLSVTIRGISPTEDEIFSYARSLRSCGRFSLVVISSINEDVIETGEETITRYKFEFLLQ